MKMSRIIEELERAGIAVTYENIAIYAVFVSEEGFAEELGLNNELSEPTWLKDLFGILPLDS